MKQEAHGDGRVRMRAARANAHETGSRTRNRTLRGTGPCAKRQSRPPLLARLRGVVRETGLCAKQEGEVRAKQGAREGVVQMCAKRVEGPEVRTRVATDAGG